jgi:PBP1b-binding outer membrane lipoprotein LpoB
MLGPELSFPLTGITRKANQNRSNMKNILTLLGLLLFLGACSSKNSGSAENLELINRYVQAVENLDFEAMDAFLAETYMGIGPSYGDTIHKAEAVANWKKNVENLYEKIRYKKSRNAHVLVASGENEGDWVSNWAELEITFRENGEVVTIWANNIYQIADGKIIKSYSFYNEADALRQLGYVFINPDNL